MVGLLSLRAAGSVHRPRRCPYYTQALLPRHAVLTDNELDESMTLITHLIRSAPVAPGHGRPFRPTGRDTLPDRLILPGQCGQGRRRSPRSPPADLAMTARWCSLSG